MKIRDLNPIPLLYCINTPSLVFKMISKILTFSKILKVFFSFKEVVMKIRDLNPIPPALWYKYTFVAI